MIIFIHRKLSHNHDFHGQFLHCHRSQQAHNFQSISISIKPNNNWFVSCKVALHF